MILALQNMVSVFNKWTLRDQNRVFIFFESRHYRFRNITNLYIPLKIFPYVNY
jgi:hypothetical protein